VEYDEATGAPVRLDGAYVRDEAGQASYGIVKVLEGGHGGAYPDMAWEPKAAFGTLAEYYRG
jgi:hypothetical protein